MSRRDVKDGSVVVFLMATMTLLVIVVLLGSVWPSAVMHLDANSLDECVYVKFLGYEFDCPTGNLSWVKILIPKNEDRFVVPDHPSFH
ncbi:MAG: hypothetical protein AAB614_00370 [Patescibacteria group bacterium]